MAVSFRQERANARRAFVDELEKAADMIADISRAGLQILLRRAALRLRNMDGFDLGADADEAVALRLSCRIAAQREKQNWFI